MHHHRRQRGQLHRERPDQRQQCGHQPGERPGEPGGLLHHRSHLRHRGHQDRQGRGQHRGRLQRDAVHHLRPELPGDDHVHRRAGHQLRGGGPGGPDHRRRRGGDHLHRRGDGGVRGGHHLGRHHHLPRHRPHRRDRRPAAGDERGCGDRGLLGGRCALHPLRRREPGGHGAGDGGLPQRGQRAGRGGPGGLRLRAGGDRRQR